MTDSRALSSNKEKLPGPVLGVSEKRIPVDDSRRCPSVHYFGRNCCQLDAGHEGPHIAEYAPAPLNWYRVWEHKIGEPFCNYRDVPMPRRISEGAR